MKKSNLKLSVLTSIAFTGVLVLNGVALAATQKSFTFSYKMNQKAAFKITKSAPSYDEAFKIASRECLQKLTNGQYPGEEMGLDYIDVCANPKM